MDRQTVGPCSESRKIFAHAPVLLILELLSVFPSTYTMALSILEPDDVSSIREGALNTILLSSLPATPTLSRTTSSIPTEASSQEVIVNPNPAKLTITDQRASLKGKIIEATECLKSWFRVD